MQCTSIKERTKNMQKNYEIYTCSICNTEINTPESKMMIDRDEDMKIKGILCVDCSCAVHREDPFVLLQAIDYILSGGYPEEFEHDGEMPKPKRAQTRRSLREQDRDLLEKLIGVREFTTLRDDEVSIPKLKGRKKATTKKKPATRKNRRVRQPAEKKVLALQPEQHRDNHQSELAA